MALFNYDDLNRNSYSTFSESYDSLNANRLFKSAHSVYVSDSDSFDIFLSHSYNDRAIIPALKRELESFGYKVYVDWINDRLLSRDNVTKETAQILQKRMKQSKSLIYATSENSSTSRWMPWELGYFDGIKDKMVAILPIKKYGNGFQENFKGEEYLGLYYYIDKDEISGKNEQALWVRESLTKYIIFSGWLNNGLKPIERN
ncbi:MAG: toll/interleukin-1 receptor domain-containing protein [Sulfuricurvum sp.]|uniref:toll/interleukin-1 receptor domain-containing protein n=1 Tax=Sulfuricurvum sp. TaxID=2025608 RepID=UPI002624D700|nr:toll/interleukin-1 receptor domain-containing protein [Sulfuricurvum sp.]MDD5159078.1 toll/interleukin-1 receptor domain-containing protein [Sulfuricurvum sp.]